MSNERDSDRQGRRATDPPSAPTDAPTGVAAHAGESEPHAAPGAPTAPAELHREAPPEHIECAGCRREIPPDEALAAEGLDYILYFCSPECHAAWELAHRSDQGPEPQGERAYEQSGKG